MEPPFQLAECISVSETAGEYGPQYEILHTYIYIINTLLYQIEFGCMQSGDALLSLAHQSIIRQCAHAVMALG